MRIPDFGAHGPFLSGSKRTDPTQISPRIQARPPIAQNLTGRACIRIDSLRVHSRPTFPIWLPKIGHILHRSALSCSNVLVAGFAPHDARHGDLNSGRRTRHHPQFSDTSPVLHPVFALVVPAAIARQPVGRGSAQIRWSIDPKSWRSGLSGNSR